MLLLAFHIVTVAVLVGVVGSIAYRMGVTEGERRARAFIETRDPG